MQMEEGVPHNYYLFLRSGVVKYAEVDSEGAHY